MASNDNVLLIKPQIDMPSLEKEIEHVQKISEDLDLKGKDKGNKRRIKALKEVRKFEDQYQKLGFKKDVARNKALELQKKGLLEKTQAELANKQVIRDRQVIERKAIEEEKLQRQEKAIQKGAFKGSLAGSFVGSLLGGSVGKFVSKTTSDIVTSVNKNALIQHYERKFSDTGLDENGKRVRERVDSYKNARQAGLKSFANSTEIVEAGLMLRNVTTSGRFANSFRDLATALTDVRYDIGQATQDISGFLQGGGLSEMGDFAKKVGKGNVRNLNRLAKYQNELVSMGLYESIEDDVLIKQREEMSSRLIQKGMAENKGELAVKDQAMTNVAAIEEGIEFAEIETGRAINDLAKKFEIDLSGMTGSKGEAALGYSVKTLDALLRGDFFGSAAAATAGAAVGGYSALNPRITEFNPDQKTNLYKQNLLSAEMIKRKAGFDFINSLVE